ncbi:efflux RND transporter periplasmic adaptor subunit [Pseudenhygromyxa sp. WMMC2535]|uniref:efflux RND transporter periplasmic adaptor subunit n=1 Tax=Pseudenhygromyxa sp. WMMC2535 TaxID=2712867 RepID=UPI001555D3FC|nr:efflux RND transporter periplasmic adaptor subunit [Pseudenhygromyxa sp. WMMC2535]NVB40057.1 efflux RND transporter periplasmic adaptor subunit [Pseudenhygromyxa sp. WMMC2535]
MLRLRLITLLLVAFTVMGCRAQHQTKEEAGTFLVTSPLREDAELTHEYVAQIRAIQHIELRALERGYLEDIFVDEGQQLEEGELMFQIMPIIYQAEVSKAKAETELAGIEFDNAKLLADENVVSPSELALARAKLHRAKAELELASAHRKLTEIHAPFSGIMGRFFARKGSLLEEGELLTTLSDNSTVWAYFNLSEREYLDYERRSQTEDLSAVQLQMATGELFSEPGKIETIEADFDNETGNIAFRASFPNPEGLLRHGETGKVLMTMPLPGALQIPQKATFEILDRHYVYVVGEDGVVHSRAITVAAELPHRYIISEGLEESDHILLEGLRKVHEGEAIEVEYQAPAEAFDQLQLHAE